MNNIVHKIYSESPARFAVGHGYVQIHTKHPAQQTGAVEDSTTQKIRSFAQLPVGWHYGEGRPPTKGMIDSAIAWNRVLLGFGVPKTGAFPGVSGEIMVTGYSGRHCIELLIEPTGVSVVHEVNGTEVHRWLQP